MDVSLIFMRSSHDPFETANKYCEGKMQRILKERGLWSIKSEGENKGRQIDK